MRAVSVAAQVAWMLEHDDWKLGDDAEGGTCSACGRRNRATRTHCSFCGARLAADPEADAEQLRTIGEAMTGDRPSGRSRSGRRRRWLWPAAVLGMMVVALAVYRIGARAVPGWVVPVETSAARPEPDADGTPGVVDGGHGAAPAGEEAATEVPPRGEDAGSATVPAPAAGLRDAQPDAPPKQAQAPPPVEEEVDAKSAPAGDRKAVAASGAGSDAARPVRREAAGRSAAATRGGAQGERRQPAQTRLPKKDDEAPTSPPRSSALREKPSLGTDLVEAQRAYAAAIARYNESADAYNQIADAYQRSDLPADSQEMVRLQLRLERARRSAERERAAAEMLRRRMEEVQARYR